MKIQLKTPNNNYYNNTKIQISTAVNLLGLYTETKNKTTSDNARKVSSVPLNIGLVSLFAFETPFK